MMLGSKGILTPMIPDCSVLRTPAIIKNIHNSLIFLRKMATYSYFWRVPRSKILLQASLRRTSDLLTLVSYYRSCSVIIFRCSQFLYLILFRKLPRHASERYSYITGSFRSAVIFHDFKQNLRDGRRKDTCDDRLRNTKSQDDS